MPEPKPNHCQQCGSRLSTADARGLCPNCLLQLGLILTLDHRPEPPDTNSTNHPLTLDSPTSSSPVPAAPSDASSPPDPTAHAHASPVVGRIGGYQLLEEIGRGGMGIVYRAYQAGLKRTVAVKMILSGEYASSAAVRRFRTEAQAAASLRHPNIVAIHEIGEFNGRAFFSMDLIQGKSLAELGRDGRLPPIVAARHVHTVALAIHYAHTHGILHRDLKPSNILLDQNDQPQLTDFGLAKRFLEDSNVTVSGQLLGSPNFMAPEQASHRLGPVDARSDVYATGATLYYLLTGRPPFFAGSVADTLQELLHREPLPPQLLNPTTPVGLQTICLKCLEKEPRRRYQSAQNLADDLQRFLDIRPFLA